MFGNGRAVLDGLIALTALIAHIFAALLGKTNDLESGAHRVLSGEIDTLGLR